MAADLERAETLRVWLLTRWKEAEVLSGDILQKGPPALRQSPAVNAALAILEQHGWVRRLGAGALVRGKPRKLAFRVVRPANVV